eukprot:15477721-Alexandrium_andersonii.AAC.1
MTREPRWRSMLRRRGTSSRRFTARPHPGQQVPLAARRRLPAGGGGSVGFKRCGDPCKHPGSRPRSIQQRSAPCH